MDRHELRDMLSDCPFCHASLREGLAYGSVTLDGLTVAAFFESLDCSQGCESFFSGDEMELFETDVALGLWTRGHRGPELTAFLDAARSIDRRIGAVRSDLPP